MSPHEGRRLGASVKFGNNPPAGFFRSAGSSAWPATVNGCWRPVFPETSAVILFAAGSVPYISPRGGPKGGPWNVLVAREVGTRAWVLVGCAATLYVRVLRAWRGSSRKRPRASASSTPGSDANPGRP